MTMRNAFVQILLLATFLMLQHTDALQSQPSQDKRELRRSYAKRWEDVNSFVKKVAHHNAHNFLHKKGQDMMVPVEVDVFLLGFGGYGSYGFYLEPEKLEELVTNSFDQHCPTVWESQQPANTCFQISYNVMHLQLQDKDPRHALYQVEDAMRRTMESVHSHNTPPGAEMFELDAFNLEHVYDKFITEIYKGEDVVSDRKPWHKHNVIFVVNPSKERMDPRNNETGRGQPLNVMEEWRKGDFNMKKLLRQEAGYSYSYNYYGHGHASTFISTSNYIVIDISAGPTKYGPLVSPAGGVTENSVPRLQTLYEKILSQLASIKTVTALEQAVNLAESGQRTIYEGQLSSVITSAVQHIFTPDLLFNHMQPHKRLMVPVILLRDHDVVDPLDHSVEHHVYEVDVDTIEQAVRALVEADEQVVVTSISHYLHQHPALATAVQKAMHTEATTYVDEGGSGGINVDVQTHLDSSVMLSEFSMAADMLTYGLLEAHMRDEAQDLQAQWDNPEAPSRHFLRQRIGTRVLPVFVLSLKNSPQNLVLDNGGLVAADKEAVIVLQLINPKDGEGLYSSGVACGHAIQGEAVLLDGVDITRHVVAGIAASVSGLVPPYQRFDPMTQKMVEDWRWSVGAIPHGPYTSYPTVNEIMISTARRNRLVAEIDNLVRDLQWREDRLDTFIEQHILGPLSFVVDEDDQEQRRKLDVLAVDHTSFTYDPDTGMAVRNNSDTATQQLAAKLEDLEEHLSTVSYSLFDHQFEQVDHQLDELFKVAETYTTAVDEILHTVEDKIRCCKVSRQRGMNPWWLIFLTISLVVLILILSIALSALVSRRQRKARYKSSVFKL